ncbi:hypothetical protein N825_29700 [Skermanella stibiiresistens SB22]|uniref:Cache domain-containing protein n=1 Tax=Skermanella stibiiresistens SB22 TaxID=1385369 RepID=W9GXE8_9PROT|nr:hypothetical protein [Skermanella stibiiresistens]EWY36133.1 hypothetical protein N825_29700 [Skermanella stibiiresistens SB22]
MVRNFTLPGRLIALVIMALIPAVAIQIHDAIEARDRETREIERQAKRLLDQFETEHIQLLGGLRQVLATIRASWPAPGVDDAVCGDNMRRLRADLPDHIDAYVVDAAGVIRCGTKTRSVGWSIADRRHFRQAMAGDEFVVGGFVRRLTTDAAALPVAMPFRDGTGRIVGAVTALVVPVG